MGGIPIKEYSNGTLDNISLTDNGMFQGQFVEVQSLFFSLLVVENFKI